MPVSEQESPAKEVLGLATRTRQIPSVPELLSNCGRGMISLNQPRACSYLGCSKHAHNHSLTPVPATSPKAAPSQTFFPSKVTLLSVKAEQVELTHKNQMQLSFY